MCIKSTNLNCQMSCFLGSTWTGSTKCWTCQLFCPLSTARTPFSYVSFMRCTVCFFIRQKGIVHSAEAFNRLLHHCLTFLSRHHERGYHPSRSTKIWIWSSFNTSVSAHLTTKASCELDLHSVLGWSCHSWRPSMVGILHSSLSLGLLQSEMSLPR